jgi:hypothetical protein
VSIAFAEVPVDRRLGLVDRPIIAVVNDGAGHAAENGFDHIEELCAGWERRRFNLWAVTANRGVVRVDAYEQLL